MKKIITAVLALTAVFCLSFLPLKADNETVRAPKDGLPIDVTISYSDGTVTLNWTEASNVYMYYIYTLDEPYGEFALIDSTASTLTTWNGNFAEDKHFFYVTAKISDEPEVPEGFVFVQGGTFDMGDHFNEGGSAERPVHSVTLNSFYIGKYLVTQKEWTDYMPARSWSSSYGLGDTYPAYYVSWYRILVYCNLRSMAEGLTPVYTINSSTNPADWGTVPTSNNATWNAVVCNWSANGYRLPTEAEWEYAARGGVHHTDNYRYSGCHEESDLTNYAWYTANNSPSGSKPVGTKLPNQLGLYDMSGNLFELCWDWYGSTYYQDCFDQGTVTNPYGPTTVSGRVRRGGYWVSCDYYCRVAYRGYDSPGYGDDADGGFRLSRTP